MKKPQIRLKHTKKKVHLTKRQRRPYKQSWKNLNMALGRTDVEGEGVIITFRKKEESELSEDEKIDEITSIDLVYIVNSLKDAGAEAISINDERIINTTDMADVGGSIKINSKYLRTDTYEIKAIGNKAYLESSIFGKGGYAEQLNTTGIKTDIERKNKIKITKYDGELNTKYIKEVN